MSFFFLNQILFYKKLGESVGYVLRNEVMQREITSKKKNKVRERVREEKRTLRNEK
jgi:hypothetical protein